MGKQRIQAWLCAALWLALVYSTLHITRPIAKFLREHLPLNSLTTLLIVSILAALLIHFHRRYSIKQKYQFVLLLLILACYGMGLYFLRSPEEKLHFIQYGVLAFLIFRALVFDLSKLDSYLGTLLLTILFGWIDEGIQSLLPGRIYDTMDVLLNFTSGLLALGLIFVFGPSRH